MSHPSLTELAERAGIAADYTGPDGAPVVTSDETRRRLLAGLGMAVEDAAALAQSFRALEHRAPPHLAYHGDPAPVPGWLEHRPAWGITCQLYELVSERNGGIGDFEDLAALAETAAAAGADYLGVTPLHALFLADPRRCSPFSPSSRRFLNPLYIAVDKVPGYRSGMVDEAALAEARQGDLIDYPRVAGLKLAVLSTLWRKWRSGTPGHTAFEAFRRDNGHELERHALFEALSLHLAGEGYGSGWTSWPHEFQHPESGAVAAFARDRDEDVSFHA